MVLACKDEYKIFEKLYKQQKSVRTVLFDHEVIETVGLYVDEIDNIQAMRIALDKMIKYFKHSNYLAVNTFRSKKIQFFMPTGLKKSTLCGIEFEIEKFYALDNRDIMTIRLRPLLR